jgi:hypothetical protein
MSNTTTTDENKKLSLDARWEVAIDLCLRRTVYASLIGIGAAAMLCKTHNQRQSMTLFTVGVGLGSAYADASRLFK